MFGFKIVRVSKLNKLAAQLRVIEELARVAKPAVDNGSVGRMSTIYRAVRAALGEL
jgi:hypothetical protein